MHNFIAMKYLLDGSVVVAVILIAVLAYNSNYLSYHKCMSQTQSDTITQKGADHVSAQCKAFILEKVMVK